MTRIIFDRRPIGVTLGNLIPPHAAAVAAPIIYGSNVGNAPQSHLSPVNHTRLAAVDLGSRSWVKAILRRQRRVARAIRLSPH